MANTSKTKFDRYQSLVAVTVPIMTAALAVFAYQADQKATDASGRIAMVESSINKVEVMGEYFKMMAAYIMAAGNDELHEVLRDLGTREDSIKAEILRIARSRDDGDNPGDVNLTEMQKGVRTILGDIATSADLHGWCYLGDFDDRSTLRIDLAKGLPVVGKSYEMILAANLRTVYPNKENDYDLASVNVTGIASKGATVKIIEIEPGDKPKVWAKIEVTLATSSDS